VVVKTDEDPSVSSRSSPPPILLEINRLFEQPLQSVINRIMVLVTAPIKPPLVVKWKFDAFCPNTISVVTPSAFID
jgi:hypothetical protein